MKRIIPLVLSAALMLTMFAGCNSDEAPSPTPSATPVSYAGTYEGTASGYHGDIGVTVELDDAGKLVSVSVNDGHSETANVGSIAISEMPGKIVEAQSLDVDCVSGATLTGKGIINAVAAALINAGLSPAEYGYSQSEEKEDTTYAFNPEAMPEKAEVTDSIVITDATGREVTLDLPISTYALSTMDVIDYLIPLLGEEAFSKLVASGQDGGDGIQVYSSLYVPVVGNYMEHFGQISEHNAPFDLEMILAMDPDVLIVNSAMNAHTYALEIEPQLEAAGIPIVLINVPGKSVTTSTQSTVKLLGQIFQQEERANELVDFLDAQYALIASKNLKDSTDKPTVYYEKSGYSEIYGTTSTSTSGWGALIALAGGDNIADPLLKDSASAKGGNNTIDPEYVIESDPDFVILSGSGAGWMDNYAGSTPSVPSFDIINRTGWSELKAVKNDNVYELAHAMSRSILGFYASLKMASVFYPAEFADVDPDAVMDEFFDRFMLVDSDVTGWFYRVNEVF